LASILETMRIVDVGHHDLGRLAAHAGNGLQELDSLVLFRQRFELLVELILVPTKSFEFGQFQV
jgi:hypothetical protein